MISSSTIYRASLTLIILVLINAVFLDARRSGGGRLSGGRSGSGRSSGRVSSPHRTPVYVPRTPVYVPKPPAHTPSRQSSTSGQHFPQPHTPHNSGSPHGKDSSNILIQAEGGGRPRPASTVNDHRQQSTPHQPSAPYEPANKVTVGHVQSQGNSQGSSNPSGAYPPWANPSVGQHGGTNPHAPFPSSPNNPPYPNQANKPTGPLASAPYPAPTHPAGPISHQPINSVHQSNQNNAAPNGMPMPHQNSYPYPNSPHGMPPPYQPSSAPYPGGHPQGMPMPSAPHIGFGNGAAHGGVHQPIGTPHNYQQVGSSPMQPHGGYSQPHGGYSQPNGGYSQPHGGYSQPTVVHNHYNSPPIGSPQNPAGHPMYGHQPVYGGAPMGQPFVPGQTVVVLPNQQSHDSGRGIGQIFKEALVFSTVNAGVNRIINGPSHHHHDNYPSAQPAAPAAASSATTSTVTNTVIYNNQYGNPIPGADGNPLPGQTSQAAVIPGSPTTYPAGTGSGNLNFPPGNAGAPNPNIGNSGISSSTSAAQYSNTAGTSVATSLGTSNSSSNSRQTGIVPPATSNAGNQTESAPVQEFQYFVSNEELWNITENLFAKDEINASQYITLNLQTRSVKPNATDEAYGPLLYVRREAYEIPTIQAMRDIVGNYEFDSEKKEIMNPEKRREENVMLDAFLNTNIMTTAMNWLSGKGYVETDDFEWKDTLRHIWMSKVNGATSGFERIFLAEKYAGPSVLGGQNWIYFDREESSKRIDYMSYIDHVKLGNKASLVKINFKIDDIVKPNTTMLIGTPPELEMALYTICYYTRPNDLCTVSLGGTKFNVYTHAFRYFGKDLIDLGLIFF